MAITINGKTYRNLQQQVLQNMNDIADLKEHGTGESYSAGTGINISDENVISVDNTIETKANATSRFVSKANLTDYSINEIIVGNSDVDGDNVNLRAVYSQDVKSEVSLDPTSTIIRTMSGTDTSTIGISATEIDITTPMLKYGTSEVATKADIPTYTEGQGITITNSNEIKANIGYGLEFSATESDTDEIKINTNVIATKEDIPTKLSDLINDGFVTDNSTQYIKASKIFKTATDASIGATIYPSTGSLYAEKDLTSTSYAPQKISLSKAQSGTAFNFQIQSTQGEGHNGVYTFDNSVTGTVTTKEYVDSTFATKTEVDNKDTATLNAAKQYTDNKAIAGASIYEYELIFDDSDNEDTWHYRFISKYPGLINTSVPETYQELVQFVMDYGILYANTYRMIGYAYDNNTLQYSHIYYNYLNQTLKVTFPGRSDQTIDANNLILNSITLRKRDC